MNAQLRQFCRSTQRQGTIVPNDERENGEVPVVSSAGVSDSHSVAAGNGPAIVRRDDIGSIGEFHLVEWAVLAADIRRIYSIRPAAVNGSQIPSAIVLICRLKPISVCRELSAHQTSAVPGVDRNDRTCLHTQAVLPPHADQTADYLDYPVEIQAFDLGFTTTRSCKAAGFDRISRSMLGVPHRSLSHRCP